MRKDLLEFLENPEKERIEDMQINIGTILYFDKYRNKPTLDKTEEPIAVCVVPPKVLDERARFIGLEQAESLVYGENKEHIAGEDKGWYDYDGEENTKILVQFKDCQAAKWAKEKQPHSEVLNWYLPAIGEMRIAISYLPLLNKIFKLLGSKLLEEDTWCWSSSQNSSSYARYVDTYYGYVYNDAKADTTAGNRVRAFVALSPLAL